MGSDRLRTSLQQSVLLPSLVHEAMKLQYISSETAGDSRFLASAPILPMVKEVAA